MYIDVKFEDYYLQCTLIMTAVTSLGQTSPLLLLLAAAKLIKLMFCPAAAVPRCIKHDHYLGHTHHTQPRPVWNYPT